MRDDFLKRTIEKIAHRAGYRCSKPDCRIETRGAASDNDGTINIGNAAHITAAAPGGPRYDPALTSLQRKHHRNGIWLCGTHAKLVDSDKNQFTVDELHRWKNIAERESLLTVNSSTSQIAGAPFADHEDIQIIADLLIDCCKSDLSVLQRMPGWPAHPVALNLKMADEKNREAFRVSSVYSAIESFDEIALIAPPGTGKTTTLLQLVETVIGKGLLVAGYVPLNEWSTHSNTFFESLLHRASFRDSCERDFERLAIHGRLVLILDGWNELDERSKQRARNDIKSIRRDFPDIRLIISSRHKDFDIPIDWPVFEVDVLTEEQQLEIARALRGLEGESLMDHAWRTPGLRELVAIPLYLTALLKHAPGDSLPTTKEEVIRSFVTELEQNRDHSATLRETLQGCHRDFLEAIAVDATNYKTTALSDWRARAVVDKAQEGLKSNNQISRLLQPMKILDVLVDAHALIRSDATVDSISFQHQQFQEWFASFRAQRIMLNAASGHNNAIRMLREDVLNVPVWEESVLFVCDRLSRADQSGTHAVAAAVLEALSIDPILAAEMIYRSSNDVWKQVRNRVISFTKRWHSAGRIDRAMIFMITTGRADFSQTIWPLISNSDSQVYLHALGSTRRFRISVLGADVEKRIAALPEKLRGRLTEEIAFNSEIDGIELAARVAENDESAKVKSDVIEALIYRRADRFINAILDSAPDEVWHRLAKTWRPNEFSDPQVSARIEKEARALFAAETDPRQILQALLRADVREAATGPKICDLIQQIDFSENTQSDTLLIQKAYELYPADIIEGLLSLLVQGKQVPFRSDEMIRKSDVAIDNGPLVDCILNNSYEGRTSAIVSSLVGPKTIGKLFDQMSVVQTRIRSNNGGYNKALIDEHNRLENLISGTKANPFAQAVLERKDTEDPHQISLFADLISRHGRSVERTPLRLDVSIHENMTATVQRWAGILLASHDATRSQLATIPKAAERLESPELVPALLSLLSEDLKRRALAREELLDALGEGIRIQNDARMSWTLQYRRAFAAIGDKQTVDAMKAYLSDLEFGFDAAHVLKAVCQKSQSTEDESSVMRSWPDFSVVPEEYKKRQLGIAKETHPFVDYTITVIDDLIKPGASDADLIHALKLATVAFSMPYAGKQEIIDALLQLPVSVTQKQSLLTVLALSGGAISSEIVLRGIDELLKETSMMQEQNGWRLQDWLSLLPFTERPSAILEILDRAEGFQPVPWNLRAVLSALAHSPSAEADTVLEELAKRDERFLTDANWLAALTTRNTLTTGRTLLGAISNAPLASRQDSHRWIDVGRTLSAFMTSHEQFRQEVYEAFSHLAEGPAKSVIEYAIADAADQNGILLLLREGATKNKSIAETKLYRALEHVVIGQTPMEFDEGYQSYSLPAPELRRGLFDIMVNRSGAESRLAAECLTTIDNIRDEFGRADSEPRHPNITTGVPWPQIYLE